MKKKKSNSKQVWAAVHWLGGIFRLGSEKEMKKFCKKNSFNPKAPIYYALPIQGIEKVTCDKCAGKGELILPNKQ